MRQREKHIARDAAEGQAWLAAGRGRLARVDDPDGLTGLEGGRRGVGESRGGRAGVRGVRG
eukprot:758300-Hanusia_phi.AAC.2